MSILVLLTSFALALALSASLTPLVLKFSHAYSLFDQPDDQHGRRIHLKPIPRLGGISIVVAFFLASTISQQEFRVPVVLLMSLMIFFIGAVDDIRPLTAAFRFFTQILICGWTVYAAGLEIKYVTLSENLIVTLPFSAGFALSTFIIVGAINALNMIDGLDGLAGGISVIAIAMLSLLNYLVTNDLHLMFYLSIPAIEAILGFLRYNTHPASIFMGDNGSNWLGFMIGLHILMVLTIKNPYSTSMPPYIYIPFISALLCFAVPIIDTSLVIFRRVRAGVHPMRADKLHFHHRLLRLGLNQSQSVGLIYFISIGCAILGILPVAYPQYDFTFVPWIALALLVGLLVLCSSINWSATFKNPLRSLLWDQYIKNEVLKVVITRSIRLWERGNKYILFLILAVTPIFAGSVPESIGHAAIPLLLLTIVTSLLGSKNNDFFESLILTLSCILLLVANNHNTIQVALLGKVYNIQFLYNSMFVALFFSSVLFMLLTIKKNYLVLTPSDFLLLILPIALILFPEIIKNEYRLDIISIRSFIIFLAYRTLEKRRINSRRHLKMATIVALTYIIMVSLLKMRLIY